MISTRLSSLLMLTYSYGISGSATSNSGSSNGTDFPEDFDLDLSPLDELDYDSLALGPFACSASLLVLIFFNPRSDSAKGSSKGDKSKSKSSGKSVPLEEPEFEVADPDMPHDQVENPDNDDEEPKEKDKIKAGNDSCIFCRKPSKTFDELMSTPIEFSAFIMNDLNINNLTQETLLGPAFRLLKGTRSNYAELEYDFEECYKGLSEKLDWENPKGGDCPFDPTKPLPFSRLEIIKRQRLHNMIFQALKTWFQTFEVMLKSPMINMHFKESHIRENIRTLAVTQVELMRKHEYGYLKEIVVRRADNDLYKFKEGDFPRLRINDIEDMLLLVV
nr:hypothetical protein [Tanacetum cinerariifolium]